MGGRAGAGSCSGPRARGRGHLIWASGLTRRYGSFVAVDRLDLAVPAGSVFGLLGPNGAGKSNTIKMLTTLLASHGGSARVGGLDVVREAHQVRRIIGYVPRMLSADSTLWLLIFGQVMGRLREVPTGGHPYRVFMAPGILAQSVLFISIFYGIQSIRERDMGLLHKYLSSPLPRVALVLGKAVSAGVRGVCQAALIYFLAAALGVGVRLAPAAVAGVLAFTVLGAALFATFSLIIACLVPTQERLMGIGQVLTMPLFFAPNAIYPLALMPPWLQVLSHVNPLSYQVDALRTLMLPGGASAFGLALDGGVLLAVFAALAASAARLYPRLMA